MSGPLGYQLATSDIFFAPPQNVSHMPVKMIAAKLQLRDVSIFPPLIVVLVK